MVKPLLRDTTHILPAVVLGSRGQPVVNSKHLANHFEKRHADVLQDIDRVMDELEESHGGNLHHVYFQEVSTPHPTIPGRLDRSFDMTKDGFTLLAMGFTGPKALTFKLAYLQRFNEMEAALQSPTSPHAHYEAFAERVIREQGEVFAKPS